MLCSRSKPVHYLLSASWWFANESPEHLDCGQGCHYIRGSACCCDKPPIFSRPSSPSQFWKCRHVPDRPNCMVSASRPQGMVVGEGEKPMRAVSTRWPDAGAQTRRPLLEASQPALPSEQFSCPSFCIKVALMAPYCCLFGIPPDSIVIAI